MKKVWYQGKNILLSGASSGIGFCLAEILVCDGANVMGFARNLERLQFAKQKIDEKIKRSHSSGSFNVLSFDVLGDWQDLKDKLDAMGFKVDVIINNAGIILPFDKFYNISVDDAKMIFEVNFFSHLKAYKTFADDLKERKGAIINIGGSTGLCPMVGQAVYSASKSADRNFTQALAEENRDLYVAMVCPGYTDTKMFREQNRGSFVKKIATPANKMAQKIVKGIRRKKRLIVVGKDAHQMSIGYRLCPESAPRKVAKILKKSKDEMFNKVF